MNAQEYRERTAKELGLAGNHPDAIAKHLDAYEAALAHELAEKIRTHDVDYLGAYHGGWLDAADLIDPEVTDA